MDPILIGYFANTKRMADSRWIKNPAVIEFSNATEHGPAILEGGQEVEQVDWINEWKHNDMWVFDAPELAWSVVPVRLRPHYCLYAYRMLPVQYGQGEAVPYAFPKIDPVPMGAGFEFLGWDVVSRYCDNVLECSPLLCNGVADKFSVNPYCLLESMAMAIQCAKEFFIDGAEPGPYAVIEVWREKPAVRV
ncbi:MAG TPA: hypothetical protein VF607_03990 [Verrucomicrobiae bacterium]